MKKSNGEAINLKEIKIFQEFLKEMEKNQANIEDIILTDINMCNNIVIFYLHNQDDVIKEIFALKSGLDVLLMFLKENEHLFNDELKQNAKNSLCTITETINKCLFKNREKLNNISSELEVEIDGDEIIENNSASKTTIH